jgi:hypothetical protein
VTTTILNNRLTIKPFPTARKFHRKILTLSFFSLICNKAIMKPYTHWEITLERTGPGSRSVLIQIFAHGKFCPIEETGLYCLSFYVWPLCCPQEEVNAKSSRKSFMLSWSKHRKVLEWHLAVSEQLSFAMQSLLLWTSWLFLFCQWTKRSTEHEVSGKRLKTELYLPKNSVRRRWNLCEHYMKYMTWSVWPWRKYLGFWSGDFKIYFILHF